MQGQRGIFLNFLNLFSDICFDMTTREWFQRLISEGYLCQLIGKPTVTKINGIANLSIVGGDYNAKQSEALIDTDEGKDIGLSYLKHRGFREDTIKKFQLGYNPDAKDKFANTAAIRYNKTNIIFTYPHFPIYYIGLNKLLMFPHLRKLQPLNLYNFRNFAQFFPQGLLLFARKTCHQN